MEKSLNLFDKEKLDLNHSKSYTELNDSSFQQPISDNDNIDERGRETGIKKFHSFTSNNNNISIKNNLFYYIKTYNIKKIKQILTEDYSQINIINKDGLTPLHFAVLIGNIEAVSLLLKRCANPNILSINEKQTPLHLAYLYKTRNNSEIIKLLLKYNADQNILDIHYKKPNDYLNINIANNKICFNQNSHSSSCSNKIIQSQTTNRNKNNSNSTKKINKINLDDIKTPIKYPCLKKYKEDSYIINDSIEEVLKNEDENNVTQIQNRNLYQEFLKIYYNKIKSKKKLLSPPIKNNYDTDTNRQEILSKKNSPMNSNKISTTTESDYIGCSNKCKKLLFNKKYNNINAIENFSKSCRQKIYNSNKKYYNTDMILPKAKINDFKYNNNKYITKINYFSNFSENINEQKKINLTEVNKQFNKFQEKKFNINNKINNNLLRNWLSEIGLLNYYPNFIFKNINNINFLINKIKHNPKNYNFDYIKQLLNIQKSGHCFRILTKLESDAGLIDNKIKNFFIENQNNDIFRNNNLLISISQDYCLHCCCIKNLKSVKKNDLRFFLIKYDLMNLYSNFVHNGFDNLNFVILQMYSRYVINDDMLINHFHIYDRVQRNILLSALEEELKKINYFLNSKEYDNYSNKDKVKYSNIFFDVNENYKECYKLKFDDVKKNSGDCYIY